MIDHDHKFIHIHIHRTAGASIASFFNNPVLYDHRDTHDYIKAYGQDTWDDYFTFAFVRNPWDKVVGHYFWRQQKAWWFAKGDNLEFKQWVKSLDEITGVKGGLHDPNTNQWDWISDEKDQMIVNFVGYVEHIGSGDWNHVCDKIGIEHKPLPHLNTTKHKHYSYYYDEETKEIVAKRYAKDIDKLGFRFAKKDEENLVEKRLKDLGYLD